MGFVVILSTCSKYDKVIKLFILFYLHLEKYKITPKCKTQLHVPFCRMVPMLIVRHVFKIDILKMEHVFHMGYKEGDKIFKNCFH